MNIGTLTIEMAANVARLQRDMDASRRVVTRTFGNIERDVMRLRNLIGTVGSAFAAAFAGRAVINQIDTFTKFTAQLRLASRSAEEFANAQAVVRAISKESQADISSVGVLYARIANATRDLGISQERVANITRTVSLALKVSGATAQESASAMLQLSQAFASGVLRGEEFNAVNEAAPRLMKALADGLKVPIGALRGMAQEGQITSDILADVLPRALQQLEQEARAVQTISGAFQQLKNEVMLLIGATAEANNTSGFFARTLADMAAILGALNSAMGENTKQSEAMRVIQEGLAIAFETVAVIGVNVAYVIEQIIAEIAGMSKQVAAIAKLNFEEAAAIRAQMIASAEAARAQVDATTDRILNARRLAEEARQAAAQGEDILSRMAQHNDNFKASAIGAAAASKKMIEDFEKLRNKIITEESGLDSDFYKNMDVLRQAYESGKIALEEYMVLAEKYIKSQKFYTEQTKARAAAEAAAFDELFEKIEKERLAKEKAIKTGREIVEALEFETEALKMTNEEREVAIRLRELEAAGMKKGTAEYEKFAQAIRESVETRVLTEKSMKQQEDIIAFWKKINDDIGRSLTDALMEGGQNAKELLKNLFKTMILRPVLQPIVSGIVGSLGLGASGGALAQANTMSQSLGLQQTFTALKGVYDIVTGGFTALGNSVAFAAQDIGAWLVNNTTGVLNQAGASIMQASNTLGTMASYAGGALAGYGTGMMISGQYSALGSNPNTAVAAGTAIGAVVGGPIGAFIGGSIGGLVNRAFGRGPKQTQDVRLQGTLSTATGADVVQAAPWAQKGGWFRSSRSGTDISPINESLQLLLDQSVMMTRMSTQAMLDTLNQSSKGIDNFTKEISISIMGLTGEEQQALIASELSKFGDSLVEAIAPQIVEFQRRGETAGETLVRLSSSLTTVNRAFENLRVKLYDVNLYGGEFASQLIDIIGGIEGFIAATDFFYQNFYTEAERAADTTREVSEALAQFGVALPPTRDAFRELLSIARSMSDDTLVAALLKIAPAFASITQSAEDMAQAALEAATAQVNTAKELTDAAYDRVVQAVNAEKQIVEISRQAAQEQVNTLQSLFDFLSGEIDDLLRGAGTMSAAEGMQFLDQAIATASATGYLPEQADLASAVGAIRGGLTPSNFATSLELRREQAIVAGRLNQLRVLTGDQLTTAEKQLAAVEKQLTALDEQLAYQKLQLDALRGVNTSVLSMNSAISQLAAAIRAEQAAKAAQVAAQAARAAQVPPPNPIVGAGGGSYNTNVGLPTPGVQSAYDHPSGVNVVSSDSALVAAAKIVYQSTRGGVSTKQFDTAMRSLGFNDAFDMMQAVGYQGDPDALRNIYGFADGGRYPGGLALVGEEGPELINFADPGMVYNNAQTKRLMDGNTDDLRYEMQQMRDDSRAQARALVQLQNRTLRLLERWDGDGLPEERDVTV